MAFKISDFISLLDVNNSVAKSDHFDVFITLPPIAAEGISNRDLSLLAETAELPGKTINTVDYRFHSFTQRIPHIGDYSGGSNFTFLCTGTMFEKKLFDRWMDLMVPAHTGLISYPEDGQGNHLYDSTITVNQYDPSGTLIYSVDLIDAIPVSVSPLSQDWNNDSIHKLQVHFMYKKWTSVETQYNVVSGPANLNPNVMATSSPSSNVVIY